ncbi:MAG: hypothetical protein QOJ89_3804 [bacterium]|jgi:hypothetical protein
MKTMSIVATSGALLALAAATAPASPHSPLSKRAFIASADHLCTAYSKKLDAITPPGDPELGPAGASVAYAWHGLEADLHRDLHALRPPAPFAARWHRGLASLADRVTAERQLGDAELAYDRKAVARAFSRMNRDGDASGRAFHGYGFKSCGVT